MGYYHHQNQLLASGFIGISITLNSAGHLTIPVRINRIAALMTVDTGASSTCIDENRTFPFNLHPHASGDRATGLGVYGEITQAAQIDSLRIGSLELRRQTIVILSLDHINHAYSEQSIPPIDGVIGSDLLNQLHGIIDYSSLTLFLRDMEPAR